jgi:hypothetical protein
MTRVYIGIGKDKQTLLWASIPFLQFSNVRMETVRVARGVSMRRIPVAKLLIRIGMGVLSARKQTPCPPTLTHRSWVPHTNFSHIFQ